MTAAPRTAHDLSAQPYPADNCPCLVICDTCPCLEVPAGAGTDTEPEWLSKFPAEQVPF